MGQCDVCDVGFIEPEIINGKRVCPTCKSVLNYEKEI
jgi:hypothetical protein